MRERALIALGFALCLLPPSSVAEVPVDSEPTGLIRVVVTGLTTDDALVEVSLWRGADGWLDRNSETSLYRVQNIRAEQGIARALFEDVPVGDYAVTAFQDDNENGRLDQGLFRIPKERLGFSNGVRARFSAPVYEDAAVLLETGELQVEIELTRMP